MTKIFREGQTVKRLDTGEPVRVVEVLPLNLQVFYRIEHESGDTSLVPGAKLREVC